MLNIYQVINLIVKYVLNKMLIYGTLQFMNHINLDLNHVVFGLIINLFLIIMKEI